MQWLPILVSSLQILYNKPNNLQESEQFLIGNRPKIGTFLWSKECQEHKFAIVRCNVLETHCLPFLSPRVHVTVNIVSLMLERLSLV